MLAVSWLMLQVQLVAQHCQEQRPWHFVCPSLFWVFFSEDLMLNT